MLYEILQMKGNSGHCITCAGIAPSLPYKMSSTTEAKELMPYVYLCYNLFSGVELSMRSFCVILVNKV